MYFNEKKSNTNIDKEFKQKNSILSSIKKIITKYKILLFITIAIILLITMICLFAGRKVTNYLTLNGEEIITIYQGNDYIEPGYTASNSKDVDLTSDVIIKSNLNINAVGEYEITYTIGDITKTRIVKVIEKPKEYTYIYLRTVNDSVNVYVEIGKEYVEPGYQVFSSTGVDLTDSVKITGSVDTTKKGNYKLIYSVVDSNNVTVSVTRTVIVMDSDIDLSLNTKTYTNQDVTINVKVIDDYFDYIVLPNGEKILTNTYAYKVSENGKYTFTVYNKKGITKQQTIEVKNIDRISPTGSCTGIYKDGKSTININATDTSGISKYVINNKTYTSNQITINSELKTVNIAIYDNAGNTKNISCNLSDKNEPIYKEDPIYKQESFHDNSINGIRFILYNQHDSRWGDTLYSGTETFTNSGCVSTSIAVVLSAYDTSFQPVDVPAKYRSDWPTNTINELADGAYTCTMKWGIDVRDLLLEGKVIIIEVRGKKYGGNSKFTTISHYMSLLDYDKENDKIFIGNGASDYGYGKNGWYKASEVLTSVYSVHICTPSEELLKKYTLTNK